MTSQQLRNKIRPFYQRHLVTADTSSIFYSPPYRRESDDDNRTHHSQSISQLPLQQYKQSLTPSSQRPICKRSYHTTNRKEILPLIGMGALVFGVYSYRALKRMDKEWEEYEEALKEYELEYGPAKQNDTDSRAQNTNTQKPVTKSASSTSLFKEGILAVDLGTFNIRVAHRPSKGKRNPQVVVNREGARATPNKIMFESDGSYVTGKMALDKLYMKSSVVDPTNLMISNNKNDDNKALRDQAVQLVVSSLAYDALEQVLGRKASLKSNKFVFSLDSAMTGGFDIKPIFTYPPPCTLDNNSTNLYLSRYKAATASLCSPDSIASYLPEPICIVSGARHYKLIPSSELGSVMVIDIGGKEISISIVDENKKKVTYHSRIQDIGGFALIESLMNFLSKSFFGTGFNKVTDGMAVQRLFDACQAAVMEISSGIKTNHGRVQVNIPYLSIDSKMQPRHLNEGVSAKVLEAEFTSLVLSRVQQLNEDSSRTSPLSENMKQPKDLANLFTSILIKVFQTSNQNPFALGGVLITGGGARSPVFQNALKLAFSNLAGEQFMHDKLIIPKDELIEELLVLGATIVADST